MTSPIPTSTPHLAPIGAIGSVADPADAAAYLTPDALMAYCETKLQGIDSQVQQYMAQQQNTNAEQQILNGLSSNLATYSTDGIVGDKATCQTIEGSIETAIDQIQSIDPNSPALAQLEKLHDSVMATGSGTYPGTDGHTHGYYNLSTPGASPPDGPNPPSGISVTPDGNITSQEIQGFTSTLSSISGSLNENSQLQMIQIQSLMSDRTSAIQLTTNILQAFDDGTNKIVQNVGH